VEVNQFWAERGCPTGRGKQLVAVAHQCWQRKGTREFYAVRLQGDRVTGFLGPLTTPAEPTTLPHLDYQDDTDRCDWLQMNGGEFLLR
jgi:hypothetical protein